MAFKRLLSQEKSLEKNTELKEWTLNKYRELVAKGYLRRATSEYLNTEWPRVWYLPQFVIINENKLPVKPRLVNDAAATYQGVSLNSEQLTGPDLLLPLNAGLYKLREKKICVTADMTEMYHQIKLNKEDQQCQRILWRECDSSKQPNIFIFESLSFGPKCAPAIAQAVKNFHAEKFADKYKLAVDGLVLRTYMDDYFNSHSSLEEAVEVSLQAVEIMKSAGFELAKFQSNSREFLLKMPVECRKESVMNLQPESDNNITKVLGMFWDTAEDCFTYRLHEEHLKQELATHDRMPTKRQVLRLVMKVFDPLGLISNFTIRGRIILQEIWRDGTKWDMPINERLLPHWKEWTRQLKSLTELKIPRQYAPIDPSVEKLQLHVFCDASGRAYAACAYMRVQANGKIFTSLIGAKAKVVPVQLLSIPRAELLAALLGARLSKSIVKLHSISFETIRFWSDSKTVLSWICSDTLKFKQFVSTRINEILESTTR
jgi:Pao retrotransposon peptidase